MRVAALLFLAVASACVGTGASSDAGEAGEADDGALVPSLEVKVTSSSVRLLLHVTNDGERPLTFRFPTAQRFDFEVLTTEGEQVWRWSADRAFAQVVSEATLQPAETWAMEAEWSPGERSGRFVARGRVTAETHALEQETTFELR